MPRKAPTEVIEHRITFGDYERKEIKEALDINDKQKTVDTVVKGGTAVLVGGTIIGAEYITYLGLQGIFGFMDIVTDPLKEIIFGKETYETSSEPPANPDDWVNRDPETGERINPVHNVPVMGGLVGLGIKAGEAVPVGTWISEGWDSVFG